MIRRVCSRISGPLIRMPSWAPRPVPTISAVGVASPSAHGQAMISTATAAVKAAAASPVSASQPASVASAIADHDGDEDRRDAVDEPLDRRLPRLRFGDEAGDLRQSRVGADLRRLDDEATRGVDRRTGDRGALPHLDGNGLAGQHRLVDCGEPLDHDPVGRDLLAGTDDEPVPDHELVDRHEHLGAVAQARARPSPPARAAHGSPHRSGGGRGPPGSARAGSAS